MRDESANGFACIHDSAQRRHDSAQAMPACGWTEGNPRRVALPALSSLDLQWASL